MRWGKAVAASPIALLLLVGVGAAKGGKDYPLDLAGGTGFSQRAAWIEQQDDAPQPADPIINPLAGCYWSMNDHFTKRSFGYLDAGASVSRDTCVVSDFTPVYKTVNGVTAWWSTVTYGLFGTLVRADSPDLTVTVCYQPQGFCTNPSPALVDRSYVWKFCGEARYRWDDPALTDIEGSNGGRGVITTVTLTIGNPTGRRVRGVEAYATLSSDFIDEQGCVGWTSFPANQTPYPMLWTAS